MHSFQTTGRVAGTPVFTPKHTNAAGKLVQAQAEFTLIENLRNGKKNHFRCTAWGTLAYAVARGAAKGKDVSVSGRLNTYKGRVFWPKTGNGPAQPVMIEGTQTALTTTKMGITVQDLNFGADSMDWLTNEVEAWERSGGREGRPPMWYAKNHPDNGVWQQICAHRNNQTFQMGMTHFGYAEVRIYQGMTVVDDDKNIPASQKRQNGGNGYGNQQSGYQQNQGGGYQGQQNGGYYQGGQAYGNQGNQAPQYGANPQGMSQAPNGQVSYGGQNLGQAYDQTGTAQGGQPQYNQYQGNPHAVGQNMNQGAPQGNAGYPPQAPAGGYQQQGGYQAPAGAPQGQQLQM